MVVMAVLLQRFSGCQLKLNFLHQQKKKKSSNGPFPFSKLTSFKIIINQISKLKPVLLKHIGCTEVFVLFVFHQSAFFSTKLCPSKIPQNPKSPDTQLAINCLILAWHVCVNLDREQ